MRSTAFIVALIGAVVALLTVVVIYYLGGIVGGSATINNALLFGALLTVLAFVAAGMVRERPGPAAALLALAALGFWLFTGRFGVPAAGALGIAALLAIIGRADARVAPRPPDDGPGPAAA